MLLEVSYLGVPVKIYSFTGTVLDNSKQRETKVTGSGGGGAVYNGSGAVAPVSIQSSTTVHDQMFLIDDTGYEKAINLQNWNLSVRTGHIVQILWAITGKENEGPYVTVKNQNLNTIDWADTQLKNVVSPCLRNHLLIGLALSIVVGYFAGFGLFVLGIIITSIYFFVRRNIFAKDLKEKIQVNL